MNSLVHARLVAVLALLALLPCLACSGPQRSEPPARRGVLDLAGWEASRDGPVALDGQWEFYWDRLLDPEDFRAGTDPPQLSGYLDLPGFWKNHDLDGRPLPGKGLATFRLRVLVDAAQGPLGLRLFSLPAAYRLFVNGRLLAQTGVVGRNNREERPERSLVLVRLPAEQGPLELVLQISNHSFRRGGVHHQILLGEPEQLEGSHIRIWSWAMFFAGSLLVMAIYHFFLYFLRKKEVSTLYFGLHCLALAILNSSMDSSYFLVNLFLPAKDNTVIANVALACYGFIPSLLYRFYGALYPGSFPALLKHLIDARSLSLAAVIVFLPNPFVFTVLPLYAATSLLINASYLVLLVRCHLRGQDGALLLFYGCLILGATSLCELYTNLFGTSPGTLFPLGLAAFVLTQAYALARRFSRAFADVESMSRAMELNNAVLRTEMEERRRLEREIVSVSEEERRRLSHNLHDGLCQLLTGARLRCSVLEREFSAGAGLAPGFVQLCALLNEAVEHAYALSRGLWPVEHEPLRGKPSLEPMVQRFRQSGALRIELRQRVACDVCSSGCLDQVFRIAQEALANAVKHSKGANVFVELFCTEREGLTLTVRDDGQGRTADRPSSGGLGLRIMAYRAKVMGADLVVTHSKGGTLVTCTAPCTRAKPRPGDPGGQDMSARA